MSWALHRVDDRLIHGQVVVAWGHQLRPRRIWVVDDASAANDWERDLLADAAPGVEVKVVPVEEGIRIHAEEAAADGAALLLVRDLRTAVALVEGGAIIPLLNLGGLHYAPGRSRVNDYVYLDEDDRARCRRLMELGVRLEVQDIPATRARALIEIDPAIART